MNQGLVFIACGQLTPEEKRLGKSIEELFKKYNVNTFLAEVAHDLEDLNSHIFKNLNNCTGFAAVLHKRNRINGKYDTSVWVNQEIAIIAYLKSIRKNIPSLVIIEEGAEQEGLIRYTIANPMTFKSDEEALAIIDEWAKVQDFHYKDNHKQANTWTSEARERAKQAIGNKIIKYKLPYWEVAHSINYLLEEKHWRPSELISVARNAEIKLSGWPIGVVSIQGDTEPKARNFGIVADIESDYWELHKNGQFYFMRMLEEGISNGDEEPTQQHVLHFDTNIRSTTEALLHCQKLYQELKIHAQQTISFQISFFGLKGRILASSHQPAYSLRNFYKCEEDIHEFSKSCSIELITNDLKGIVYEATRSLFELFNWFGYQKSVCDGIIDKFLSGKY